MDFLNQIFFPETRIDEQNEEGIDCFMHLARTNDIWFLRFLIFYCEKREINLPTKNKSKNGNSLMHYIVSPFGVGTFERKSLVEFLCTDWGFGKWDLSEVNNTGHWPIDLIKNCKESETYKACLDIMKIDEMNLSKFPPAPDFECDIVMNAKVDFEKDAKKYMANILKEEEKKAGEKKKKDKDEPDPDPLGKFGDTFEVLKDKTGYYSILMTWCDLNDGYYGTYLFYKL